MRKKLFAILMSAMMMVTFMPAMAFAATTGAVLSDNLKTITYQGHEFAVTEINAVQESGLFKGLLTAKADLSGVEGFSGEATVDFYDLSYVKVQDFHGESTSLAYDEIQFTSLANIEKEMTEAQNRVDVMFTVPSYVTNYATAKAWTSAKLTRIDDKKVYMDAFYYDHSNEYQVQSFTMNVSVDATAKCKNTIPAKALKVGAKAGVVGDLNFYLDNVTDKATRVQYDGAEHTVVATEVPGFTVTGYKVQNSNGTWDAVSSITLKDVKRVNAKAVYTYTSTSAGVTTTSTNQEKSFTVEVYADYSKAPTVEFAKAEYDVTEGFDAAKLVEVVAKTDSDTKKTPNAKAAAANEELLKAYFNDFYEVKVEAVKDQDEEYTAKIVRKDLTLTTAEKDAFLTKYATLYNNFGITWASRDNFNKFFVDNNDTAKLHVITKDIEWVKAPLTKKYYNKSGKLAKTYTFQVEAKADAKVTYKLQYGGEMIKIDKATGKVTVKKGLKVGTYKVVVTASAKGTKGTTVSDTYVLTIKMAKKK